MFDESIIIEVRGTLPQSLAGVAPRPSLAALRHATVATRGEDVVDVADGERTARNALPSLVRIECNPSLSRSLSDVQRQVRELEKRIFGHQADDAMISSSAIRFDSIAGLAQRTADAAQKNVDGGDATTTVAVRKLKHAWNELEQSIALSKTVANIGRQQQEERQSVSISQDERLALSELQSRNQLASRVAASWRQILSSMDNCNNKSQTEQDDALLDQWISAAQAQSQQLDEIEKLILKLEESCRSRRDRIRAELAALEASVGSQHGRAEVV